MVKHKSDDGQPIRYAGLTLLFEEHLQITIPDQFYVLRITTFGAQ